MPPPRRHHHPHGGAPTPSLKPNRKGLSLILKAIIMTVITTLHRHSTPSSNSSKGLSSENLKMLPRFRFSTEARSPDQSACVVCLKEFRQDQWCRILDGCCHVFHRKCVDAWLVKVSACPICRTQLPLGPLVKDGPLWDFD